MKFFLSLLVVGAMAFGSSTNATALENAPGKVWGIGGAAGSSFGAYAFYAVSSTLHIGSGVGIQLHENSNVFMLSPYAKFLFPSASGYYPFIYAQLGLAFGDASGSALGIGGGMQAWVDKSVSVWASLGLLDIGFDPSYTIFGLVNPRIGVEFIP